MANGECYLSRGIDMTALRSVDNKADGSIDGRVAGDAPDAYFSRIVIIGTKCQVRSPLTLIAPAIRFVDPKTSSVSAICKFLPASTPKVSNSKLNELSRLKLISLPATK